MSWKRILTSFKKIHIFDEGLHYSSKYTPRRPPLIVVRNRDFGSWQNRDFYIGFGSGKRENVSTESKIQPVVDEV